MEKAGEGEHTLSLPTTTDPLYTSMSAIHPSRLANIPSGSSAARPDQPPLDSLHREADLRERVLQDRERRALPPHMGGDDRGRERSRSPERGESFRSSRDDRDRRDDRDQVSRRDERDNQSSDRDHGDRRRDDRGRDDGSRSER